MAPDFSMWLMLRFCFSAASRMFFAFRAAAARTLSGVWMGDSLFMRLASVVQFGDELVEDAAWQTAWPDYTPIIVGEK
jgi:hypothetical protein